ncbi:MAG: DUF2806 domain-containing protein, partial [Chloroflexota bacterium]
MDIKDAAGIGKLVEVVVEGIGGFSKPLYTRWNANAEAHAQMKKADADAYSLIRISSAIDHVYENSVHLDFDEHEIVFSPEEGLTIRAIQSAENRTLQRERYQALKQQNNIEQITYHAAEELKNAESVSDEPVDPDWISRFFESAKDISTEEMQLLWG